MKRLLRTVAATAAAAALSLLFSVGTSAAQMKDVNMGDWYYGDVVRLSATGILGGYPDGRFYPDKNITCAEFTKVLISSIGVPEDNESTPEGFSAHWAAGYIGTAYSLGIISDGDIEEDFSPDEPITRSLMTKMTVLALDIEPAVIKSPFIDANDPYANAAYSTYLLRGYDTGYGTRVCHGDDSATRAEAAAIAVRILDYREDPYEYQKKAILENASLNSLDTEAELIDFFYVLNREFIGEYTFSTRFSYDKWAEIYKISNRLHFDSFYSEGYDCSYIPGNTTYTIRLRYTDGADTAKRLFSDTERAAKAITDDIITEEMTKAEKARAIHDYLVLNCKYDIENYQKGTIPWESYLAYGALCKKTAVCQGYTNAFNLLCKFAGLQAITVSGYSPESDEGHAWNMLLIDGKVYSVDVTHDDPVPDEEGRILSDRFMLTESEMKQLGYRWNADDVAIKYFH